jgi:preprotein translocase subunit YajC
MSYIYLQQQQQKQQQQQQQNLPQLNSDTGLLDTINNRGM